MNVDKKNIIQAFKKLKEFYPEFDRDIKNYDDIKKRVNLWAEMFENINFKYDESNEDFEKAVNQYIIHNPKAPRFSDISDEMKQIYEQRQKEIYSRNSQEVHQIRNMLDEEGYKYIPFISIEGAVFKYGKLRTNRTFEESYKEIKTYLDKYLQTNEQSYYSKSMEDLLQGTLEDIYKKIIKEEKKWKINS